MFLYYLYMFLTIITFYYIYCYLYVGYQYTVVYVYFLNKYYVLNYYYNDDASYAFMIDYEIDDWKYDKFYYLKYFKKNHQQ